MKYVLIIGDGMADNELPELDGKTPLEYAKTPAMDKLAGKGVTGSVLTVPKGLPAGTDTAVLSILGCDPATHYSGRASLEAAASNIRLQAGDIAYRCNMVTLEDADKPFEKLKILSHSAGGIEGALSDALVRELFEDSKFKETARAAGMEIFPSGSFRHIAVQRTGEFQHRKGIAHGTKPISNSEIILAPPHDHIGESIGPLLPKTDDNAKALSRLMLMAHGFLNNHPINEKRRKKGKMPANGIWFWAKGIVTSLPSFCAKYGKKSAVISAVPLCQGIGALMGFYVVHVPGATGELNTNYEGKVDAAVKSLEKNDFVVVHVEAPDECSHDGDLKGKLQAIEWLDSRVVAPLTQRLGDAGSEEYKMMILSDHKTLISTRGHDGSPVPYILFDSRHSYGNDFSFCEKTAAQGEFVEDGTRLMDMLFSE